MKIRWILPSVLMRCWDSGDAPLAHTMLSTWELLRLSLSPPDREPTVGWWDSVLDLTQGIHLIYFIQFLVANSNSSFYWRWSLTHSVRQSRHTSFWWLGLAPITEKNCKVYPSGWFLFLDVVASQVLSPVTHWHFDRITYSLTKIQFSSSFTT